ncbi:MAG: alpha-2-macroglobulin family protein [Thermoanaerobaculia bacterium]
MALRFNQPVDPAKLRSSIALHFQPHEWLAPSAPAVPDPAFHEKLGRALQASQLSRSVPYAIRQTWNKKLVKPGADLVVLETVEVPPTNTWISIDVAEKAPAVQGPEVPGAPQQFTLKTEPPFFVTGLRCSEGCDPDNYNPLLFSAPAGEPGVRSALRVSEIADGGLRPIVQKPEPPKSDESEEEIEPSTPLHSDDAPESYESSFTLEELGYEASPARAYRLRVAATLRSEDGEPLGYSWTGTVENLHQAAFLSFGSGHGVWEASGGSELPFSARNLQDLHEWVAGLTVETLFPTIQRLEEKDFGELPPGEGRARDLSPVADKIQSYGLNLKSVLSARGTGLAWAGLSFGKPIPRSLLPAGAPTSQSTIVQVTNLGINVKDSPQNTLIFVTRLDDAAPVGGARVTIRSLDNKVFWSGETDPRGLVLAPRTALRDPKDWWKLAFLVTAEKDGDVAYLASNWNEGTSSWVFGIPYDLEEALPILRGSIFTDRGVYKPGEQVHFKAVFRSDTAEGMNLLPPASAVSLKVTDSQGKEIDARTILAGKWSSSDGVFTLPEDGPLGSYRLAAECKEAHRKIFGQFLVAAYRRPDFRVGVKLAGEPAVAGAKLSGVVSGRYLFGAVMKDRPVRWTYSAQPVLEVPAAVRNFDRGQEYEFLDPDAARKWTSGEPLQEKRGKLGAGGDLDLSLETKRGAGIPLRYTLEGEVTDVSRQTIAGRASSLVHPAPWYVAVRKMPYFVEARSGADTSVAAVALDGSIASGVPVVVTLEQVQWHSVRRADGNGFYTWDSKETRVPAGKWTIRTTDHPIPLHVPVPEGGFFVLAARARDAEGRFTTTASSFYATGEGYTAWQRFDGERIDIVAEKPSYRPGETARILVKSPWEKATLLLTTEREGVRRFRELELTSTQQTVEVPVSEEDIPNVYVSVVLVKGRSGSFSAADASDPGKPAFRLGYAELKVEDARKRLTLSVEADRQEYRPSARAAFRIAVHDADGKPVRAEATLWAVDTGVLDLTAYKTPDILGAIYQTKALGVSNEDSRQRIVSRRVLTPKGADSAGGGGRAEGPGTPVRKDFRPLALWLGSVETDSQGNAATSVQLPDSLTAYRVMAVAADGASRFGKGDAEIRTSKPVLLKPAFPRFLAAGDRAEFGSVVFSQLKSAGTASVSMKSLDPDVLEVDDAAPKTLEIAAGGSAEVRFHVHARTVGRARLRTSVELLSENDAFEETLPIEILVSPEVVAAYGQVTTKASEKLDLPGHVVPAFGGLRLELSSTALSGLGEGAGYLVEYPYGCAEQRASRGLAILLAADLGGAFHLPGISAPDLRKVAQENLKELESFQCADGGFGYWKGECPSSPYLTSYVTHVFQRGAKLGYDIHGDVLDRAYKYLDGELGQTPPQNEGWRPAYTAWQAFATKVLAEGGRREDSNITRLYGESDRMPVFGLTYLLDAMASSGEKGERPAELVRRIDNAVLPEGGTAHVEELPDPYLLWFWSSNVRSTALALGSLVRQKRDDASISAMVRWLLKARDKGRWGNTQENAQAMEALVDYYRALEKDVPDFSALVSLSGRPLVHQTFKGRDSDAVQSAVPMKDLLARGGPGGSLDLELSKAGAGTLFYSASLTYASDDSNLEAMDKGIFLERSYSPTDEKGRNAAPAATFRAGDLVRVTLKLRLPKERRFVAVTDPLPAGFEPVESWFATTAADLSRQQVRQESEEEDWTAWWKRGGFDHVERRDDRVLLFATRLSEGEHSFSYVVRATTSGTFKTAPSRAEEMYEPEVFGRTASATVEVKP